MSGGHYRGFSICCVTAPTILIGLEQALGIGLSSSSTALGVHVCDTTIFPWVLRIKIWASCFQDKHFVS